MDIKRKVSFYLQKVYAGKSEEAQIRMRIRFDSKTLQFNAGFTIHPDKWDSVNGIVTRNASNKKGFTAFDINQELTKLQKTAEEVFRAFEVAEKIPSETEYKTEFNKAIGKQKGTYIEKPIKIYLNEFVQEQGSLNSWADSTKLKFITLSKHLHKFNPQLNINHFTEKNIRLFIEYLKEQMNNESVLKMWKLLSWFLRWCERKQYITCFDFKDFKLNLKTVYNKEVVYLTWDELMALYELKFPADKKFLERVRDVFCFQCFTSLRYSDVSKLKRENIQDDTIRFVSTKTSDNITIDLNKYSRQIYEKYKDEEFKDNLALPVVSNQKMNKWIKDCCCLAGINSSVTYTYYKGSERIDEVKPKCEMIGTHSGRRTFICNALIMGIPASTVMEWTGHSDYKAMRPYIGVADKEKKIQMAKFDEK